MYVQKVNLRLLSNEKIANIAKAAIHMLPGKSSLNVSFSVLSVLVVLSVLSVCPMGKL